MTILIYKIFMHVSIHAIYRLTMMMMMMMMMMRMMMNYDLMGSWR